MEKLDQNSLNTALWAAADEMRKTMSADVYKNFLLPLVFYKNLSDRMLYEAADLLEEKPSNLAEAQKIYEDASKGEDWNLLQNELMLRFGTVLSPNFTFTSFYNQVNNQTFLLSNLAQAFRDLEQSQGEHYEGLFGDFEIDSKDLGKVPAKRNELISAVITALSSLNFNDYSNDALGDAYEYLIAQFASESGKKAGEFYTPHSVSKLIAQIVTFGQEDKIGFSVYDPAMGSGSLLLQAKNYLHNTPQLKRKDKVQFFGQEIKNQTYNLARMNMMLHKIPTSMQHLRNGDTLDYDWPIEEPTNFDAVVMNPPYSQKWGAKKALLADPRFSPYRKLPPPSKADYAFLLHGFYHLKNTGTMGIVLPHGVLYRDNAEAAIREALLRSGRIYAVIGLPPGIFYSTEITTCIVVLKKDTTSRDVLFIDASREFTKNKAKNLLKEKHIEKIFKAYKERKDIERFAHLASFEELEQNGFNLNISRYVDSTPAEEEIELNTVFSELKTIDAELDTLAKDLNKKFQELGLSQKI